jgi:PPK2 family polyphosphate:nucleotide phosphotransferase
MPAPAGPEAASLAAVSRLSKLRAALRVEPGKPVELAAIDPSATHGWKHAAGDRATASQLARLADLQDRLWAEDKRKVLVVLQGIDAAGKDGTIRAVMGAFNPQGVLVSAFKVPTAEEAARDFLWRVHRRVPGAGEIGIFNRSHYEEVLIVRVHELVPRAVWSRRYGQIRDFERELAETGTTIVKFFLYISHDEQRRRFQERYDNPRKRWKFSLADLAERKRWDDYMAAYQDALRETSAEHAPWYVIPANHNWFRNLAVSSILAETIDELKPAYPPEPDLPADLVIE